MEKFSNLILRHLFSPNTRIANGFFVHTTICSIQFPHCHFYLVKENIKFQSVERQAAEVINIVTGSKLKYPEGKGDVNMCLAIQQMREESKIEGAVETYKDLGISLVETIKRIAERFQLTENESSELVKQYW